MIDSLLRVLLGVVVSILAAVVLLPITVLIGKLLRIAIGNERTAALCQLLGTDGWNVELADKVETAIIGGLIGGIVFTTLSPVLAPAMYDMHVQSGIVDTPEPTLSIHELSGVSDAEIAAQFDIHEEENYSLYVVELRNEDNKVLENYNLNLRFPGCVEETSLGATNLGAAVISNETTQVQVGEFANRSANTTCYGAVQIDEFPASSSAILTFVVDHTPEGDPAAQYPAPESAEDVLLTQSYAWAYSGRSYYEPAQLVTYDTTAHERTLA